MVSAEASAVSRCMPSPALATSLRSGYSLRASRKPCSRWLVEVTVGTPISAMLPFPPSWSAM
jgi:hypothetical protein